MHVCVYVNVFVTVGIFMNLTICEIRNYLRYIHKAIQFKSLLILRGGSERGKGDIRGQGREVVGRKGRFTPLTENQDERNPLRKNQKGGWGWFLTL